MPDLPGKAKISRRTLLKKVSTAGISVALVPKTSGSKPGVESDWLTTVESYLQSLARSDGGYGWGDQPHSHLTPTFAVIGCYQIIGLTPPNKGRLADFVRTHHPSSLKRLEQPHRIFDFQQIQSLIWLGEDLSLFRDQIAAWEEPLRYMDRYEQHGYPVFQSEATVVLCRDLLKLSAEKLPPCFITYIEERRRKNGSFNNTPASDGSDGHVMNTWWGLRALDVLGRTGELREETLAWFRSCQLPNGGFTYQPKAEFSAVDDVAYTWTALRAMKLLDATPENPESCKKYLWSLWNQDGGFGDRAGWNSNPVATYYALDCLRTLEQLDQPPRRLTLPVPQSTILSADLKVLSIQIQALGRGSPSEAVDLAGALKIHFWGAKNALPGWIERAQKIADSREVPVTFFAANEEYGTWIEIPGLGTYSHMSDVIAPSKSDFGPSQSGETTVSWPEFRNRRILPLQNACGRLIWQFGENEELVRMLLDESLQCGGYAAISTFHFGNPDFTNSEPFLNRFRGQIPFIALQDAHGQEPWWLADMTTGFRTVFLARERTWEGWLEALRNNWVVAIRRDAASGFKTWMHGGSDEVIKFVLDRAADWQWWDNSQIQRPMVSIVPVKADDEFEVARPKRGVMLRVRCAWENSAHGVPKEPITELVKLILDGKEIRPELIEVESSSWRDPGDHYHQFSLPDPVPGLHKAEAIVRHLGNREVSRRTIEFCI